MGKSQELGDSEKEIDSGDLSGPTQPQGNFLSSGELHVVAVLQRQLRAAAYRWWS